LGHQPHHPHAPATSPLANGGHHHFFPPTSTSSGSDRNNHHQQQQQLPPWAQIAFPASGGSHGPSPGHPGALGMPGAGALQGGSHHMQQLSPLGASRGLLEPVGSLSAGESDDGGSGKSGKDDGESHDKYIPNKVAA
jgi:hypothetical protein